MALTVRFFKNVNKKTNSTFQPSESDPLTYTDFTCTLKDGTSILDPVFDIYLSFDDNPAALGYNYCKVPALNRYYFVHDWKYVLGVWTASCCVDVLASYKTEIGSLTKYVLRSASSYNPGIIDNCMTLLPPDKTIIPMLKNNQLASIFDVSGSTGGSTGGFFVLGVQGYTTAANVPCIGGVNYYALDYVQMKQLLSYLTSQPFAELMKDDAAGLTAEVVKVLQDPSQYIVSCQWFPWTRDTETAGDVQIQIGYWQTSPLTTLSVGMGSNGFTSMSQLLSFGAGFNIPDHPQEASGNYGTYLRATPYSIYNFHLEPWGDIPIDGSLLTDADRISGSINIDLLTGQAALNLFALKDSAPTKTIPLGRYFAQVGVNVGIAQLMYEMQSFNGSLLSAGASVASNVASLSEQAAAHVGQKGLIGAVGRLQYKLRSLFRTSSTGTGQSPDVTGKSIIQDAVSSGLAYMANPQQNGINGSYLSYYGITSQDSHGTSYYTVGPYLEVTHFTAADVDIADNGRPLREKVQLNTLSGYIECADPEHDISALESEKNMISASLTGGFFYE